MFDELVLEIDVVAFDIADETTKGFLATVVFAFLAKPDRRFRQEDTDGSPYAEDGKLGVKGEAEVERVCLLNDVETDGGSELSDGEEKGKRR